MGEEQPKYGSKVAAALAQGWDERPRTVISREDEVFLKCLDGESMVIVRYLLDCGVRLSVIPQVLPLIDKRWFDRLEKDRVKEN